MKTSSAQKLFNTVVGHLRKQGRKSMGKGGCLYRGPEGMKCAVGCLITDEEYREDMEYTLVRILISTARLPIRLARHGELLSHLQYIHDHLPVDAWEIHLTKVAEMFQLKMPKLD